MGLVSFWYPFVYAIICELLYEIWADTCRRKT